jgi:hypothetical protein
MNTVLKQVASCLEKSEVKHETDAENQCITTGFKGENLENIWLLISVSQDEDYFRILAPQVLTNIREAHAGLIFQALLHISSQTNMVRWSYDPMDREISATVELPLLDGELTEKQFEFCLEVLVRTIDEIAMPRLQVILETGIDPGEEEIGERLLLNLEEAYPGAIAYIEQALLRRKSLTFASKGHLDRKIQSQSAHNWQHHAWQYIGNVVASLRKLCAG